MANDKTLAGGYFQTSDYAELYDMEGRKKVRVRGSVYQEYANYFQPEDARKLARYILELADDAERDPALEELEEDLSAAVNTASGRTTAFSGGSVTVAGGGAGGAVDSVSWPVGRIAESLYRRGYRKS